MTASLDHPLVPSTTYFGAGERVAIHTCQKLSGMPVNDVLRRLLLSTASSRSFNLPPSKHRNSELSGFVHPLVAITQNGSVHAKIMDIYRERGTPLVGIRVRKQL